MNILFPPTGKSDENPWAGREPGDSCYGELRADLDGYKTDPNRIEVVISVPKKKQVINSM